MNDAVRYFQQDKRRDPSEVRSKWIITQLLRRPHRADEIKRLAGGNGLGYSPSTYTRDLLGLVKRRLIDPPDRVGGAYSINNLDGMGWAHARGLLQ